MVEWRGSKRIRSARAPAAFIDPALPVKADRPPSGANWIHEIKHDGYRLQIHTHGKTVRLFTMTGVDWTARYPWIVEGASALNADVAVIDAECCVAGHDGVTRFDALHDRTGDAAAFAYAFDLMMVDGEDVRALPIEERKARLAKLVRRKSSIQLSEHRPATAQPFMRTPASWGWRASFPSGSARAIAPAAARHGSRSRTRRRRAICAMWSECDGQGLDQRRSEGIENDGRLYLLTFWMKTGAPSGSVNAAGLAHNFTPTEIPSGRNATCHTESEKSESNVDGIPASVLMHCNRRRLCWLWSPRFASPKAPGFRQRMAREAVTSSCASTAPIELVAITIARATDRIPSS